MSRIRVSSLLPISADEGAHSDEATRVVKRNGSSPAPVRFAQLDSLRAFAVIAVVSSHTMSPGVWASYGSHGVRLFFVMSGFLITGILLDVRLGVERSDASFALALRSFFVRRTLRIFPVYYLTLALAALLGVPGLRANLPYYFSYLSNWKMAFDGAWHHAAHLWSLAVEEQFYLFWPFVLFFTPRRVLPWLMGAMVLFAPLLRLTLVATTDLWSQGVLLITPSTFDSLGGGALLALAWRTTWNVDRIVNWTALVAFPVFIFEQAGLSHDRLGSLLQVSWPFLCVWAVHWASRGVRGPLGRVLSFPPLRQLGIVSYGVYLFHVFVPWGGWVLQRHTGLHLPVDGRGAVPFAAVALVSTSLAALSYALFERPINQLKDRFTYLPTDSRFSAPDNDPKLRALHEESLPANAIIGAATTSVRHE